MLYDYFDYCETPSEKERNYIFNFPLLWFIEELPVYVRFLLACVIITFMVYRTVKTNGLLVNLARNMKGNTDQSAECNSEEEDF